MQSMRPLVQILVSPDLKVIALSPFVSVAFVGKVLFNYMYTLGYSDFHNLMGFTSKKMPNNIL